MSITTNNDQRLFVFKEAAGVSYMGFDVVFDHCRELSRRIASLELAPSDSALLVVKENEIGTMEQYQQYRSLLKLVDSRDIGTWFNFNTPKAVRTLLEKLRKQDTRVRVFYGDVRTGRCWISDFEVLGRVGRSGGQLKIPLLLGDNTNWGGGILDSSIVKIIDADTFKVLYEHPEFFVPEMQIREVDSSLKKEGLTHGVWVKEKDGQFANHANFQSLGKAAHWIAFMHGETTQLHN